MRWIICEFSYYEKHSKQDGVHRDLGAQYP